MGNKAAIQAQLRTKIGFRCSKYREDYREANYSNFDGEPEKKKKNRKKAYINRAQAFQYPSPGGAP